MAVQSEPMSLDEYFATDFDTWFVELVDGQPIVTPAPANPHQRALGRLHILLAGACPGGYECLVSPVDWVLRTSPRAHVRQPDLSVVRSEQAGETRLTEAPLLVVEVLSPTSWERDAVHKRAAYAEAGALYYWLVDLDTPEVVAYTAVDGVFVETARVTGDASATLSGPFDVPIRPSSLVGPPNPSPEARSR